MRGVDDAPDFEPGDIVDLTVWGPGGPGYRVGTIRCLVLRGGPGGGEVDLMIYPGADLDEAEAILAECDMALADVREGPVYVLCNCQPEHLELIRRT